MRHAVAEGGRRAGRARAAPSRRARAQAAGPTPGRPRGPRVHAAVPPAPRAAAADGSDDVLAGVGEPAADVAHGVRRGAGVGPLPEGPPARKSPRHKALPAQKAPAQKARPGRSPNPVREGPPRPERALPPESLRLSVKAQPAPGENVDPGGTGDDR